MIRLEEVNPIKGEYRDKIDLHFVSIGKYEDGQILYVRKHILPRKSCYLTDPSFIPKDRDRFGKEMGCDLCNAHVWEAEFGIDGKQLARLEDATIYLMHKGKINADSTVSRSCRYAVIDPKADVVRYQEIREVYDDLSELDLEDVPVSDGKMESGLEEMTEPVDNKRIGVVTIREDIFINGGNPHRGRTRWR